MTTLYIVRHGEYENPNYLFPGRLPGYPLSPKGREQVGALGSFLRDKGIGIIISSPIQRARQTADIISHMLRLPVRYDLRLMEVRTNLDGTSMKRFDETMGELSYLPEYIAMGAESIEELANRMYRCLEEIRTQHDGKTILIVTHGDPLRFGLMKYLGISMTFPESRKVATPLAGGYRLDITTEGKASVEVLPVG